MVFTFEQKKLNMKISNFVFFIAFLTNCKLDHEVCYDEEMEESHSGICPRDCPQVCGCDGKTYCNECNANSKGVTVDYVGPCR
jgi:hypothetical protein